MTDHNLNDLHYDKKQIDDNEIQGLSQIEIERLRAIYQTVDKETQKKDVTKITSKSSAAAIINAIQSGYKLETNYDPKKFKSILKLLTEKIGDDDGNQKSLKNALQRQFSKLKVNEEADKKKISDSESRFGSKDNSINAREDSIESKPVKSVHKRKRKQTCRLVV